MNAIKTAYDAALPYTTSDRSLVRELLHPELHGELPLSVSEVVVAPRERTALIAHPGSDHVCHVLEGKGFLRAGESFYKVSPRDSVFVPRGTAVQVVNTGDCFLRVLKFFTPAQAHDETRIVKEDDPPAGP
ncbi:MAG: cupin domain-containing protein [Thermodesulfobacteriota bacterium]